MTLHLESSALGLPVSGRSDQDHRFSGLRLVVVGVDKGSGWVHLWSSRRTSGRVKMMETTVAELVRGDEEFAQVVDGGSYGVAVQDGEWCTFGDVADATAYLVGLGFKVCA